MNKFRQFPFELGCQMGFVAENTHTATWFCITPMCIITNQTIQILYDQQISPPTKPVTVLYNIL